jgi:LPS-assembly lipoprotein
MSLSKHENAVILTTKRGLSVAFVFLLAGAVTGCVEPLYAPRLGGGSLASDLRAIKVEPIPERIGHYLENELIFALNGAGSSPAPKYRLTVTIHERLSTPIVNTVTGEAQAGDVNVDAEYRLDPIEGGGNAIAAGSVTNFVVYDRSSQRLSNVRAARDAEIRNAKVLADLIRARIATALSSRS